jgi:ribosomal subunit interface protein
MLINIRFIDCDRSESLESHIQQKIDKLQTMYEWLETVNVIIRQDNSRGGKNMVAELEVHALHNLLFAEDHDENAYAASDSAVEKMKKQLEKLKTKITQ